MYIFAKTHKYASGDPQRHRLWMDEILTLCSRNLGEDVRESIRNDPSELRLASIPLHRPCLASACLTVRKDCPVEAGNNAADERHA